MTQGELFASGTKAPQSRVTPTEREQAAKCAGMELAAEGRAYWLAEARRVAKLIDRLDRELEARGIQYPGITADDVQCWLEHIDEGYRSDLLGNAAGSIFKGKEWRWTEIGRAHV